VDSAVGNAHNGHSSASALVVHDEVQSEVFNEEGAIVSQGASEKSVQHSMASSICNCAGAIRLFLVKLHLPFPYSRDCPPKALW